MNLRVPDELQAPAHILEVTPATLVEWARMLSNPPFPGPFTGLEDIKQTLLRASMADREFVDIQLMQDEAVLLYHCFEFINGDFDPERDILDGTNKPV